MSAAMSHPKAGDPIRATNLIRAALGGLLRETPRKVASAMLAERATSVSRPPERYGLNCLKVRDRRQNGTNIT